MFELFRTSCYISSTNFEKRRFCLKYLVKTTLIVYIIFDKLILFETLIIFLETTIKLITGIFDLQKLIIILIKTVQVLFLCFFPKETHILMRLCSSWTFYWLYLYHFQATFIYHRDSKLAFQTCECVDQLCGLLLLLPSCGGVGWEVRWAYTWTPMAIKMNE